MLRLGGLISDILDVARIDQGVIAAVHGGDLSAESQPGKGARFSLTLPLARESGVIRQEVLSASPRR